MGGDSLELIGLDGILKEVGFLQGHVDCCERTKKGIKGQEVVKEKEESSKEGVYKGGHQGDQG